jgi:hypothetical protein
MKRTVRVIETYVPGLNERPASWCERLQENVSAALSAEGTEIEVLAIPNDETLMWLVWGRQGQSDPGPRAAAAILREATGAEGSLEIERTVVGFVVPCRSNCDAAS